MHSRLLVVIVGLTAAVGIRQPARAIGPEIRSGARTHALLVSGGICKSSNHLRFWGNMSLAFCMLRHDFGVPRENMRVLWASGDPSSDLCLAGGSRCLQCRNGTMPKQPSDLDGDGAADLDGAATAANVRKALAELRAQMADGDQLFVYVTDHGSRYGLDKWDVRSIFPYSRISLWDGESFLDYEFAELTNDLENPVVFAFQTCYSGGIIAELMDGRGLRFVASADADDTSQAGSQLPNYDQWSYQFLSALRGFYPRARGTPARGSACRADADGDGRVSFREAARFAYTKRPREDIPQYAESWTGCGNRLFPVLDMDADGLRAYEREHQDDRRGYLGFRQAYALTLSGGAKSPEACDSIEFALERLHLSAPKDRVDGKGRVSVFQRWTVSPSGADLGPEFNVQSPETVFTMPMSKLTLAPTYVDPAKTCSVTLSAVADRTCPEGIFFWSPDGKTWYRNGATAVLAPGSYSLRWKSSTPDWKAPSARIKTGKLLAGDAFDNGGEPSVFTYVPGVNVSIETCRNGTWIPFEASGKVTLSPAGTRFEAGKRVKLSAKAKTDYVFSCWICEDAQLSSDDAATVTLTMPPDDVRVVARFVTAQQDLDSIALSVGGRTLDAAAETALATNLTCGVRIDWPVVAAADSATTVSASGLPTGLKLVKDKSTGAYSIAGVPTTPSKTAKGASVPTPSKAKLTVKTAGKNSRKYCLAMTIDPLPDWAYGTFSGFASSDGQGTGVGAATLTVRSSGSISGKFSLCGTNWTYSASGFLDEERPANPDEVTFGFSGEAKQTSKRKCPFNVRLTQGWSRCTVAVGEGDETFSFLLHRKVWKDKPLLPSPKLSKTSLAEFGYANGLFAKVSSSGTATFSGKLNDGTKVSSSSLVFLDEKGLLQTYLIVPATKKYSGYLDEICIEMLYNYN